MEMTIAGRAFRIGRRPLSGQELRQKYDAYASKWHRNITRQGYVDAYTELAVRLQGESGPLADLPERIELLDNGIGTAALSLGLAAALDSKLIISGVDFSGEMLLQARDTLAEAGQQIHTYQRDARALGFAAELFDMVVSAHLLEHLPDPAGAIQEMSRVLKPGRPLLIIVSKPTFYTRLIQARWRFATFSEADMRKLLLAAGLENIQSYPLKGARPRLSSHAFVATKPGQADPRHRL